MSRYRKSKSLSDHIADGLVTLPWQGNAILGGIFLIWWVFGTAGWRGYPFQGRPGLLFGLILVVFGGASVFSVLLSRRHRIALMKMKTLADLQALSWQKFEELAGTYFRERGFSVVHTGRAGPDGGFDLVLRKDGKRILVQCKKYSDLPVSVEAVREFFGVVTSEEADRGIFITTSRFTSDAMEFASGLRQANLELVPGLQFAEMVSQLGRSPTPDTNPASPSLEQQRPCCPKCDTVMVPRTARRGPTPGEAFWGCSNFPDCTGTREMEQRQPSGVAA